MSGMFRSAERYGFRLIDGPGLLPVFFSTLCISPNFNTGPLGNVALVLLMLWFPAGVLVGKFTDTHVRGWLMAAAGCVALATVVAFTGNTGFGLLVLMAGLLLLALSHFPEVAGRTAGVTKGLFLGFFPVLFAYTGFNGYDLSSLFQAKVMVLALVWLGYFLAEEFEDPRHTALGTLVVLFGLVAFVWLSFGGDFGMNFSLFAAVPVVGHALVYFPALRKDGYLHFWRWITALVLTVGLIRLFLVYTNVIQVFS